jgi:hypothetical protein
MMEHPYRVHSSIGFGFLQLLFMSSLAYPTPPPPVYHNIAVIRLMATVYFTIFQDKPLYLKLECATILLEVISDTLYIQYIIRDYTYIFGVFDICSNILFCVFVILSIKNATGGNETKEITEKLDDMRKTCVECCFGLKNTNHATNTNTNEVPLSHLERPPPSPSPTPSPSHTMAHLYKSLPRDDHNNPSHRNQDEAPVYTFGGRQAFKPSFYNSSWGRDYIHTKVEREFDKIDKRDTEIGEVGMISGTDGTTQYIRFDDMPPPPDYNSSGINHYANIFVSPYFMRDGTPITWFSGCPKIDKIGACLFIYNIIQFIYQLMMYSSIITSCRENQNIINIININNINNGTSSTFHIEQWLC